MELEFTVTPVDIPVRKMDMGRVPVCSKCGAANWSWGQGVKCCGETITLREYVETVRKETFNADAWTIEEETIHVGGSDGIQS